MRENIDILGVFHDGSIVEIRGVLPKISLRIEIEYLRNMFSSKGDSFLAHLTECESIEFLNWENENRTTNLKEIATEEPEILSIEQNGDIAHVICSTGELDILYKEIKFQLDSGEPVTYKELADACNKYWDDWESRKKS
jgi:hypothetical protein